MFVLIIVVPLMNKYIYPHVEWVPVPQHGVSLSCSWRKQPPAM